MYTWGALNDNAKEAKILWTITEPCLNPPISAGGVEKSPFPQNLRFSSWSYDNTLCLEMIQLHKQKDGFKET